MRKNIILSIFIFIAFFLNSAGSSPEETVKNIKWFGQAALKINTGKLFIYIDPYQLKNPDKADIILITHDHSDHYSKQDIDKLKKDNQIIIAPFDINGKNIVLLPGKTTTVQGVSIEAVPAYNIKKINYHPKGKNFAGYILTINGVRIYIAGDTEKIPEMDKINCDIAFLPLGQTYTMNSVQEAVESAITVKAKIAIPYHFGLAEGTEKDAKMFVEELKKKGMTSFIMNKE